ncbi:hypothetical protein TNCV_4792121 [Trichonephila clavipes]|nr:hypothetical protein TNCV_4792121 [Trichonephila clavipes]
MSSSTFTWYVRLTKVFLQSAGNRHVYLGSRAGLHSTLFLIVALPRRLPSWIAIFNVPECSSAPGFLGDEERNKKRNAPNFTEEALSQIYSTTSDRWHEQQQQHSPKMYIPPEVVDIGRQINLQVDSDDIRELLNSHNQESTMDYLTEMHEQQQEIEELES